MNNMDAQRGCRFQCCRQCDINKCEHLEKNTVKFIPEQVKLIPEKVKCIPAQVKKIISEKLLNDLTPQQIILVMGAFIAVSSCMMMLTSWYYGAVSIENIRGRPTV